MTYTKSFHTYEELLALLKSRGLDCGDDEVALTQLKRIGYFRLGAYLYPLRELLPIGSQKDTPFQHRSDKFLTGAKLSHAIDLYKFDVGLRKVLEGTLELEVSLRALLSHHIGAIGPLSHLDRSTFDQDKCDQPSVLNGGRNVDAFGDWIYLCNKSRGESKEEEFVRHLILKYGQNLPVWACTETLTLGGTARLLNLVPKSMQTAIAKEMGLSQGATLHKWVLAINGLRNGCAHSRRLFNRNLGYEININPSTVGEELHGVALNPYRKKLYVTAGILAYLLIRRDCGSTWPSAFKTQARKFPKINLNSANNPLLSPEANMGFSLDWDKDPLWSY